MKAWAVQWHITTRCEQRCQHCYIFNSPEGREEIEGEQQITWPALKAIADDIGSASRTFGARCNVALTGGDPLLHPHFWELLGYLRSFNGVRVSIMGNPWLITDEVAEALKGAGIGSYQLSIDGMREVHDSWRKSGSFERSRQAVRTLQEHGIRVAIMTTVSKANAADIPRVIEMVADELRVATYAFARYVPTHGDLDQMFTPEEYRCFLETIWPYYAARVNGPTSFNLKDHLWTLFLQEKGLFALQDTKGIIVDGCGLGIRHLSILANGTVYACRRFHSPLGQVPHQKLANLFLGSQMDEYRDVESLAKCRDCFLKCFCRGCRAVAYGVTGDWRAPDPQCWR